MNSKKDVVAQLHKFSTSAPDGSGQFYALAASRLVKRRVLSTQWTGAWLAPETGLTVWRKERSQNSLPRWPVSLLNLNDMLPKEQTELLLFTPTCSTWRVLVSIQHRYIKYYRMWTRIIAQPNTIQILQKHGYWFLFYFTQDKTFQILELHKIIQYVYIYCWMRYFWENHKDQFEPVWICLQNAVYKCNTLNLFKKRNS